MDRDVAENFEEKIHLLRSVKQMCEQNHATPFSVVEYQLAVAVA
jgi:hypothetical protein